MQAGEPPALICQQAAKRNACTMKQPGCSVATGLLMTQIDLGGTSRHLSVGLMILNVVAAAAAPTKLATRKIQMLDHADRFMIEMPTAERLEWLSRGAARFDPRLPGRSREDDRGGERRPSGQRREGMDRSWNGSRQPPFPQPPYPQFTPGGPNPGLPAPQSGWPSLRGPAASRPAGPREAPAETQAPPG